MIDGMINVRKEKGFTSHDVVAKLRGILRQKKIGHTGTLDPDAVGVLPVCLGKGTKLCDMIAEKDKVYEAVLRLGMTTDTQDISGTVLEKKAVTGEMLKAETIYEAVSSFVGDYAQVPPMYSALKVNGKKLYELAREGREVERKPRLVHIFNIDVQKISENAQYQTVDVAMRVHCSKGTYIRTLCHDIGEKLNTGGCMASLTRLKVGRFELADALTLTEIEALVSKKRIEDYVIAIDAMLAEYPAAAVQEGSERLLYNGNPLAVSDFLDADLPLDGQWLRVYNHTGQFAAIYAYSKEKKLFKTVKMFL